MGEIYGYFSNILFQSTDFLTAVLIRLIKHESRKRFQIYDGLEMMFLPRANFEIFCNKNPKENLPIKCMDEIYGCFEPQDI